MKIYTRTGDTGETGLLGGARVRKDVPRIEAYGTVDELNAVLGVARAEGVSRDVDAILATLQHQLFVVGAELAAPTSRSGPAAPIDARHISDLEATIDRLEEGLPQLKQFILPGGSRAAAQLHLARCVCRRAERRTVGLAPNEKVSPDIIRYLNRVGDLLFVLARWANHQANIPDTAWDKER